MSRISDLEQRTLALGTNVALSAAGGFLDAFTYIGHGHVFANAMTGNVVLLAVHAAGGNWRQSLRHLPPILTFLAGVACVRALGRERVVLILGAEISAFFCLSWLPDSASNFLIVTVICFVASLQTATFRQIGQVSYNSTFTTGNLRTLSESFFDWVVKRESKDQTIHFASICTAFALGALAGGLLTPRMHNKALLVVVAVFLGVLVHLLRRTSPFTAR